MKLKIINISIDSSFLDIILCLLLHVLQIIQITNILYKKQGVLLFAIFFTIFTLNTIYFFHFVVIKNILIREMEDNEMV